MKIAVMGAGAVGCYYGGMLARAGFPCECETIPGEYHAVKVTADEDSVVLNLTRTRFEEIRRGHPNIAATVLFNLSTEMATRLRYVNLELQAAST